MEETKEWAGEGASLDAMGARALRKPDGINL